MRLNVKFHNDDKTLTASFDQYIGGSSSVEVPTKLSELENDVGYITADDIPEGGGGTVSWDDIEDKPFSEIPPLFDIQWDGNMDGRDILDVSAIFGGTTYVIKASDDVYTVEQLVGSTIMHSNGYESIVTEDVINTATPGMLFIDNAVGIVYSANDVITAMGLPEGSISNGVWFANIVSRGLYIERFVSPTLLDEKHIPDTIARKSDISKISGVPTKVSELENDAGFITSNDIPEGVTSWNDLEDKPFGEGPSKWVQVVSRFKVTPTQADDGSFTATVDMSFTPKNGGKYKIKVVDGIWTTLTIYDCECVGYISHGVPTLGYTKYALGKSGDPVSAHSVIMGDTSPTQWTFIFQAYNGQNGYIVEIYEARPTIITLDEKYLPESAVLESELEAKGYQTEAQVTELINNALGVIENGTY